LGKERRFWFTRGRLLHVTSKNRQVSECTLFPTSSTSTYETILPGQEHFSRAAFALLYAVSAHAMFRPLAGSFHCSTIMVVHFSSRSQLAPMDSPCLARPPIDNSHRSPILRALDEAAPSIAPEPSSKSLGLDTSVGESRSAQGCSTAGQSRDLLHECAAEIPSPISSQIQMVRTHPTEWILACLVQPYGFICLVERGANRKPPSARRIISMLPQTMRRQDASKANRVEAHDQCQPVGAYQAEAAGNA
jgi:hypothetical protein